LQALWTNAAALSEPDALLALDYLGLATLGSIEEDPRREVIAELGEAVFLPRRHKEHVSRAKRCSFGAEQKPSLARGDNVNLISRMWRLRIGATWRVQLHGECAVPEQFDGTLTARTGKFGETSQSPQVTVNYIAFNLHCQSEAFS